MKPWEAKALLDAHGMWIEGVEGTFCVYRYERGIVDPVLVAGPFLTIETAVAAAVAQPIRRARPYRVIYRREGVATIADRATDEVLGRVTRDEWDGLWTARTWAAIKAGSTANLPGRYRTRHEAAMSLCRQTPPEALGALAGSGLVSSATPESASDSGQPGAEQAGIEEDRS